MSNSEAMLTPQQEELVNNNQKLTHFVVNKFSNVPYYQNIQDDLYSTALFGLCKAVQKYDISNKAAFSTFAITVMRNEILMFLRRIRNKPVVQSIEEPIYRGNDSAPILLKDMLESKEAEIPFYLDRSFIGNFWDTILQTLKNERIKQSYILRAQGLSYTQIGIRLGVTRAYISKVFRIYDIKIKERVLATYESIEDRKYENYPLRSEYITEEEYIKAYNTYILKNK